MSFRLFLNLLPPKRDIYDISNFLIKGVITGEYLAVSEWLLTWRNLSRLFLYNMITLESTFKTKSLSTSKNKNCLWPIPVALQMLTQRTSLEKTFWYKLERKEWIILMLYCQWFHRIQVFVTVRHGLHSQKSLRNPYEKDRVVKNALSNELDNYCRCELLEFLKWKRRSGLSYGPISHIAANVTLLFSKPDKISVTRQPTRVICGHSRPKTKLTWRRQIILL